MSDVDEGVLGMWNAADSLACQVADPKTLSTYHSDIICPKILLSAHASMNMGVEGFRHGHT